MKELKSILREPFVLISAALSAISVFALLSRYGLFDVSRGWMDFLAAYSNIRDYVFSRFGSSTSSMPSALRDGIVLWAALATIVWRAGAIANALAVDALINERTDLSNDEKDLAAGFAKRSFLLWSLKRAWTEFERFSFAQFLRFRFQDLRMWITGVRHLWRSKLYHLVEPLLFIVLGPFSIMLNKKRSTQILKEAVSQADFGVRILRIHQGNT